MASARSATPSLPSAPSPTRPRPRRMRRFFLPTAAPGPYSVKVSGVGGATGLVIAEIYDATPAANFGAGSYRFLDVSVLKQIDTGESLTVGFNVGGSAARTVLVRAVGPALSVFNLNGTMPDPQVDLYSGSTVLASNDNWGRRRADQHHVLRRRRVQLQQSREQGRRHHRDARARQLHRSRERRERQRGPYARRSLRRAVTSRTHGIFSRRAGQIGRCRWGKKFSVPVSSRPAHCQQRPLSSPS